MRSALLSQLVGVQPECDDAKQAVRSLLARLNCVTGLFTAAEEALLRQWLRMLAEHCEPAPSDPGRRRRTSDLPRCRTTKGPRR